jgi:hypothetical protein
MPRRANQLDYVNFLDNVLDDLNVPYAANVLSLAVRAQRSQQMYIDAGVLLNKWKLLGYTPADLVNILEGMRGKA